MALSNLEWTLASFILLSCLCTGIVYTPLPPHKRPQIWARRYVTPPGPRGRYVLGSLLEWLQARNNGNMVPWVWLRMTIVMFYFYFPLANLSSLWNKQSMVK